MPMIHSEHTCQSFWPGIGKPSNLRLCSMIGCTTLHCIVLGLGRYMHPPSNIARIDMKYLVLAQLKQLGAVFITVRKETTDINGLCGSSLALEYERIEVIILCI